jgi:ATP-binding cassette subfamily F protein 3
MLVANFQNIAHNYGIYQVLRNVNATISSGQKIGLIGANGSGKTTMLRLLLGEETPASGTVVIPKQVRIGYVPQLVDYEDKETVWDCIAAEYESVSARLRMQEERLADTSPEEIDAAFQRYQRARDDYDRIEGDRFPQQAQAMVDALGLQGKMEQPVGSLSGGEKNVVSLTRALLQEPDLLLLDEPGNHLDYEGVAWLEDFILRFKGAVLIVSHNRYLLDRVVNGILHLENGELTYYNGGYSDFRATRLRNLLAQQSDYIANQKRLAQLEALVKRFAAIARVRTDKAWGKRLRARRKQLARETRDAVDKPILGPNKIEVNFATDASHARIALQLRGYGKAFGDQVLFRGTNLDIDCGERVGLIGPNGCGKTTLLRDIIAHGAWDHAVIRVGPSLKIGYSSQQQEVLQDDRTVIEEIRAAAPLSVKAAFAVLARFLFSHTDADKLIGDLSGGERNRLQLARLMMLKPNFLILDEPTNHLDIPASEAIEEALDNYDGTILVVSHDRYFLDKVVDRVIEVRDQDLISYPGNFSEFWQARKEERAAVVGRVTKRGKYRVKQQQKQKTSEDAGALEQRIQEMEQEKEEMEGLMEEAFNQRDRREGHRLEKQLKQLTTLIESLYEKWMAETAE